MNPVEDVHHGVKYLMKEVIQATLEAELDVSLGEEIYGSPPDKKGHARNGTYEKTGKSTFGTIDLDIPGDSEIASMTHRSCPKGRPMFQLLGGASYLRANGASQLEMSKHTRVTSMGLIFQRSRSGKSQTRYLAHIRAWQSRQIQTVVPIITMDAHQLNKRPDGKVGKYAVK